MTPGYWGNSAATEEAIAEIPAELPAAVEPVAEESLDDLLGNDWESEPAAPEESVEAIKKTAEKGILVGAHLILGLPGETDEDLLSHAEKLSELPLTTLKIHQLQIIRGTAMAKEYKLLPESFHLFELEEYVDLCVDFAERLHPDIYIERFASQSPKSLLIAPDWGLKNYELTEKVVKRFKERGTWQGRLYG